MENQIRDLFLLAIPVACIAWTVTHEEIFREPRSYCAERCKTERHILARKFYYVFTCEYCFSHYVTIFILIITGYQLLYADWRGYLLGGFAMVWIANVYMSLFGFLRQGLKKEKIVAKIKEEELDDIKEEKEEKENGNYPQKF